MKLIKYLFHTGGRGIAIVVLTGLLSGAASSLFVAVVNAALHHSNPILLVSAFLAITVVRIGSNIVSQWYLIKFAQQNLLALCDQLCSRILDTPFRTLERVGPARLMTTLTDDIGTLSAALQSIPSVITNAAILVGCMIYLAWLSWTAALVLSVFGIVGGLGYKMLSRRASGPITEARIERETLGRHFRTVIDGVKELKMSRARREKFLTQELEATSQRVRRLNLTSARPYLAADAWAQLMFFGLMGVMLFALPVINRIPLTTMTAYVFIALYAMTPLWGFIGAVPSFHRGATALERIEALGVSLGPVSPEPRSEVTTVRPGASIELRDVTFTYEGVGESKGFMLGPIDMAIQPGELVFLIGGNGSGKSTFVKLLTGLYAPDTGEIVLDGQVIGPGNREQHREHFSSVFSDFYLFDTVVGRVPQDIDRQALEYLKLLGLDHKVRVENGVLSTTALSQGQRRRLALLSAYLEDRPVYVFDEWAADQDPNYRQIFYSEFLPELKARGKTVIVITHDDRYFGLGDRIIKLEYGKIVEAEHPASRANERSNVQARGNAEGNTESRISTRPMEEEYNQLLTEELT